ncbi:MAG TPA: hypothetical protein VKP78_05850 [bacterium]|nr:hypothetical protein [bacterium]
MKAIFLRVVLILVVFGIPLSAAFEVQMINPSNIASGNIISILPAGLNFATLTEEYGLNFRANYTKLFGLNELAYKAVNLSWNRNQNYALGFRMYSFGDKFYNESQISVGYAHKFQQKITVAVGVNTYNLSIKDYYRTWSLALDAGSIFHLRDNLAISLLFQNVNGAQLWKNGEPLPRVFCSGVKWNPIPKILLAAEIYKDTIYPFVTRFGSQLTLVKNIDVLAGMQFNPDRYSYGLSFEWKTLEVSAAYRSHQDLAHTIYFGCKLAIK